MKIKLHTGLISLKLPSYILRIALGRILPWAWNTGLRFPNKKPESLSCFRFVCQRHEDSDTEGGGRGATYWPLWGERPFIPLNSLAPVLLTRELKIRELKLSAQSHTACKYNAIKRKSKQKQKNPSSPWVRSIWPQIPCCSHDINFTVSLWGHKRDGSRSPRILQVITMTLRCSPGFRYHSTPNTLSFA